MSCLPSHLEEEFLAMFDGYDHIGFKHENNWLAFCAQFNDHSGYVPSKNTFCGHRWEFKDGSRQIVDYGGVMVYGVHGHWVCKTCGKHRMKIYKGERYNVYNRKQIEEMQKNYPRRKPIYRQLEFR